MLEQKILDAIKIIYFAICVASILKFFERGFLNKRTVLVSIFMPIVLVFFIVDFNLYIWKKDLRQFPLMLQIKYMISSLVTELTMMPIIHTMVVAVFCYRAEETSTEYTIIHFHKPHATKWFNTELRRFVMPNIAN